MARHRRDYKSYLNNRNPPKHYPNSVKSFDEFGVENRKIILIEEYPCQNRKQPEKKEGEYIENDKNCLSKCIVGGSRKSFAMPQESITSNSKNNIQMENIEKYREKSNSIVRKNIQERRNTRKIKINKDAKNLKYREGKRKQMGQQQKKDTKETKMK